LLADSTNAESDERLKAIESTHDGFALAERIWSYAAWRIFGTRQSGLPDLKVARLADIKLLDMARVQAQKLFESDRPERTGASSLAQKVNQFWSVAAASDAS